MATYNSQHLFIYRVLKKFMKNAYNKKLHIFQKFFAPSMHLSIPFFTKFLKDPYIWYILIIKYTPRCIGALFHAYLLLPIKKYSPARLNDISLSHRAHRQPWPHQMVSPSSVIAVSGWRSAFCELCSATRAPHNSSLRARP